MSIIRDGLQSADLDVPVTSPTLNLDFANSQKLDPRITFTRGSIGTRVNRNRLIETVSANQPRFDYDPVTGECKGLLIEESRSNLLTYSETFQFGAWFYGNASIVLNSTTSPSGATNAAKWVYNTTSNVSRIVGQQETVTANTNYTFSVFLKAGEFNFVGVYYGKYGTPFTRLGIKVNLTNGSFTNIDVAGPTSASIRKVDYYGNGWYRVQLGGIFDTTSTDGYVELRAYNATGSTTSFTGDGTSGIYVWGAQLETGAFPTSYIPTTASTVTRSADNASMTGTNFSSWYNQTEGSFVSNCITRRTDTGNATEFAVLNAANSNKIVSWFNDTKVPLFVVNQSNITSFLPYINVSSNQTNIPVKRAISLADRNMRVATQGKLVTGDLGTGQDNLPTDFNRILIGNEGIFTGYLNGTISRLTYYPKALPPAQLQYLTT